MSSTSRPKSQQASRGNDLKKLKAEYGTQLSTLRELFSDWSDEDLLYALQDADGDLELAALRISEGKSKGARSSWINYIVQGFTD
jgi:CUE domain